jgi:hypothetical protein
MNIFNEFASAVEPAEFEVGAVLEHAARTIPATTASAAAPMRRLLWRVRVNIFDLSIVMCVALGV